MSWHRPGPCRLLLVGLVGCRAIVGVGDRDPPEAASSCGEVEGIVGECRACAEEACCGELDACATDAACASREACLAGCAGDPACRDGCADGAPAGAASAAVDLCLARACSASCAIPCGGVGSPVLGCSPCGESCCAEATTCGTDADCSDLNLCRGGCPEDAVDCRERCAAEHALGASLQASVDACLVRACDIASDWSCLGRLTPRTTSETSIERRIQVQIADPPGPVVGGIVRACDPGVTCDVPVAEGVTDEGGQVILTLPTLGYGAFQGYIEVEAEGLVPSRHISSLPVVFGGFQVLQPFTERELDDLIEINGLPAREPGRGMAFVQTLDCRGAPAAGVVLRAQLPEGELTPLYGLGPDDVDPPTATSEVAIALFVDVTPGLLSLQGEVRDLCQSMAGLIARIDGDQVTFIDLLPTP